jgi:hypothetical protein
MQFINLDQMDLSDRTLPNNANVSTRTWLRDRPVWRQRMCLSMSLGYLDEKRDMPTRASQYVFHPIRYMENIWFEICKDTGVIWPYAWTSNIHCLHYQISHFLINDRASVYATYAFEWAKNGANVVEQ